MGRCGCEMMIECEVKSVQIVESIEKTRRDRGDGVGAHVPNRKLLKERDLWK